MLLNGCMKTQCTNKLGCPWLGGQMGDGWTDLRVVRRQAAAGRWPLEDFRWGPRSEEGPQRRRKQKTRGKIQMREASANSATANSIGYLAKDVIAKLCFRKYRFPIDVLKRKFDWKSNGHKIELVRNARKCMKHV